MRFVTHHWGGNWLKGFDVYSMIDSLLDRDYFRNLLSLTYIGNLPSGFKFTNVRYVPPLDGVNLANELRQHHAYITASVFEPGGNHQNEGALCGLPLMYRRSGCFEEYCHGFGVDFDLHDFDASLAHFFAEYPALVRRMDSYPHTSARTCQKYFIFV